MVALPFEYAISVRQPFASAIVFGGKDIENKLFEPRLIRPGDRFGIHVSRAWYGKTRADLDRALAEVRVLWPDMPGLGELARLQGHVIGHVHLDGFSRRGEHLRWAQRGERIRHWHLSDPAALDEPFVATGRLGVWRVPDPCPAHVRNG